MLLTELNAPVIVLTRKWFYAARSTTFCSNNLSGERGEIYIPPSFPLPFQSPQTRPSPSFHTQNLRTSVLQGGKWDKCEIGKMFGAKESGHTQISTFPFSKSFLQILSFMIYLGAERPLHITLSVRPSDRKVTSLRAYIITH